MARITGVDLPREKRIEIGLTYIYGIGLTRSKEILARTGISADTRVKNLTEAEQSTLREAVEKTYKQQQYYGTIGRHVGELKRAGLMPRQVNETPAIGAKHERPRLHVEEKETEKVQA